MNRPIKHRSPNPYLQSFRLSLVVAFIIVLSLLLILRLAYMQFSQYRQYATLSLRNQMSIIPIAPSRGMILDRHGRILAENIPVYSIEIIPERVKQLNHTLLSLKELIPSISNVDIEHFNRARLQQRSYVPIPLKLKLTQDEVARFATNQYRFPGVIIKARLMRHYPFADVTAHVLGYVGRMNNDEIKRVNAINYRGTNFIGKSGIEKYYETILHGRVGYEQLETDATGRPLRTISKQPPVSGKKLYLTIDAKLQMAALEALKGKRGAVVVMSTKNGEILTMQSSPSYDPNQFVEGMTHEAFQQLRQSKDKPLYNRAISGLYPPASTIKPFIAIAGLEQELITPFTKIYDPGWYRLPGVPHKYRDWKRSGHRVINLQRALIVSCDTYFYQLGHKLGISAIEDMLIQFGFGQLTHVDLEGEAPGIVPNPGWKRRNKDAPWYSGDTLITSIGQGFMLASPLQLSNATAALSQNGQRFRPHLLKKAVPEHGEPKLYKPLEEIPVQLRKANSWYVIKDAMRSVVSSPEGTGHRFGHHTPYSIAAKTGTAQVFSEREEKKMDYSAIPEALRDHSLFIAFAPAEKPEIAIAVMVEHDFTAPIVARKIMDAYFRG